MNKITTFAKKNVDQIIPYFMLALVLMLIGIFLPNGIFRFMACK